MNQQSNLTSASVRGKSKSHKKSKLFQAVCLGVLFGGVINVNAATVEPKSYENLSKQIDIMSNIFVSSLKAQDDNALKNTKIDSLYLAGQGVVFTVNSARHFNWSRHGAGFPFSDAIVPVAPIAPISPSGGEVEFEFFNDKNVVREIEFVYEQQQEKMQGFREQQREFERQQDDFRDFREQQRDLVFELRDLNRESKDLAFQLRNANEAEKAKLLEQQKGLEKQKSELEKLRAALNKKSQEMKQQQKSVQAKQVAERKKHYQELTSSLVDVLCTYGNSLKALPKDEHVNLVIKLAGERAANSYQDKIFVVTKRDINDCAIDKITSEKLLANSKQYQL